MRERLDDAQARMEADAARHREQAEQQAVALEQVQAGIGDLEQRLAAQQSRIAASEGTRSEKLKAETHELIAGKATAEATASGLKEQFFGLQDRERQAL